MSLPRQPILTDGVIQLTPYSLKDVPAHLQNEDIETFRWFDMPVSTEASVRSAIRRWQRSWSSRRRRVVAFAIRDESGLLMGGCELRLGRDGVAQASYWIGPQYRRSGYATRSLRLLARFAFDQLRVERLEALVDVANAASLGTLRRAGFREEGILRARWMVGAERRDVAVWSMLPIDAPGSS